MKKLLYSLIILFLLTPLYPADAAIISAPADSLVKGSSSAVYYYAADGKRYVFPNSRTYQTWFKDFSFVNQISDTELAQMPLGGNVTYRPGIKMIKIQSDPRTYVVGKTGTLHWVRSEGLAVQLYGEDWNQKIDDVSAAFFINYQMGEPIESASDYSPAVEVLAVRTINEDKGIPVGENPLSSDTITLAPVAITIINITPDEILNSVENHLTITGLKFALGARVFVGAQPSATTFINESALKARVAAGLSPGLYSIQVLNPNGTRATLYSALEITALPVYPTEGGEPEENPLSLTEIFDKVAPAVVQIQVDVGDDCPCLGSGVIINKEGHILTNYHVIEGDEEVEIKLQDNSMVKGDVLGWSELRDLALIKIPSSYNYVGLGDYGGVREGDTAYTLGFPGGMPLTNISQGIILARGQIIEGSIYVLTDAEISHGSSGGPLIDSQGEIIGVVRGGLTIPGTELFYGYNFAIPADIVESLLPDLKAGIRTLKP